MANLSQKESSLLQDQKTHEEMCVKKYSNYANQAQDQQLKQVFLNLSKQEQEHLNTINQMLNGQVPNMSQKQNQQSMGNQNAQTQSAGQSGMANQNDADLCTDMLMTEKFISAAYDTSIFEFKDHNIRQTLNHIQKEEQEHGENIYNYMNSKGMY